MIESKKCIGIGIYSHFFSGTAANVGSSAAMTATNVYINLIYLYYKADIEKAIVLLAVHL
ncbi:MAG: hypothetical protein ACR5K4_02395 [Sodalis sp. (in: enterobacteria)]